MSNVHGLFSNKKDDDDESDDENNLFVGGVGERGGGSGLQVQPNNDEGDRDSVFRMAESASPEDSGQVRRTITMYRDGFVVDDGPYRRLDDPSNAEFLRDLARGQTPRELLSEATGGTATGGGGSVVVGLIDKRNEEYVPEFRFFSGQGESLGAPAAAAAGDTSIFDPATLTLPDTAAATPSDPTSIQIRLLSGQRRVVRISLLATVADLAAHVVDDADGSSFQLIAGFPPKPLQDPACTIQEAGLKGAQVSMKKVA